MNKNLKIFVLMFLIFLSLLFEITGTHINFGSSYSYVIKPMMWIFLGIITFIFFKNNVSYNKKYKKDVDFLVIITLLLYFLIYFILGYIKGFAHNPYDTTFKGILMNLWTYLPIVFVKEYIRFFMINNCSKKNILWWVLFISMVFTFTELNFGKFDSYFSTGTAAFKYSMETLMPTLIINLYLTYINYFSGYVTSMLYVAVPQVVLYVIPILPNLELPILGLLNSIVPFFSYIYINYFISKIDKTHKRKEYKTVSLKGCLVMTLIVVSMVCFGLGLFPIEPLVIASDSMYPKIHKGDIVLITDIDVKDLKKGDIIRYRLDNYYVIHRIMMITEDKNGELEFVTKGDNNGDVDLLPVKQSQVQGKIKGTVRYLGYPTLVINEILNSGVGDTVKVDKGRVN